MLSGFFWELVDWVGSSRWYMSVLLFFSFFISLYFWMLKIFFIENLTQNFTNKELLALKQQALQQQQQLPQQQELSNPQQQQHLQHQQQQQRFGSGNNVQHFQQHQHQFNNNNRQRLHSADYIYGPGGRPSSKSHYHHQQQQHAKMTPLPHSRSVSTSDFYELDNHTNNHHQHHLKEEDPTEKHINKNILIEPMNSASATTTTTNTNAPPPNAFLHPTPPRSRSPSPSVSDGDSGYSSKQMSPVSLVSSNIYLFMGRFTRSLFRCNGFKKLTVNRN